MGLARPPLRRGWHYFSSTDAWDGMAVGAAMIGAVMLLGLRALAAAAAGLAVAAMMTVPPRWRPGRLGHLLGNLSYGIYLWHLPAMLWWQQHAPTMDVLPLAALAVATTMVLALASWTLVERPVLRWARRF